MSSSRPPPVERPLPQVCEVAATAGKTQLPVYEAAAAADIPPPPLKRPSPPLCEGAVSGARQPTYASILNI